MVDETTPMWMVNAADSLWSMARWTASADDSEMRRLIIPMSFPTICHNATDCNQFVCVDGHKRPTFSELPLLGGRSVVLSFYKNVDILMAALDADPQTDAFNNAAIMLKQMWQACGFNLVANYSLEPTIKLYLFGGIALPMTPKGTTFMMDVWGMIPNPIKFWAMIEFKCLSHFQKETTTPTHPPDPIPSNSWQ